MGGRQRREQEPRSAAGAKRAATERARFDSGPSLHQLQRLVGNRAVCRMVGANVVQPKLQVGPAGDRYEQEADIVASEVMRSLGQPVVKDDADGRVQRSPLEGIVGLDGGPVGSDTESAIQQSRGGGQPLPGSLLRSMEDSFGADFSGVRVHNDASADGLNRSMQSRAFTVGSDIFFARGQYQPSSHAGQALLAHELTHTIQQGAASGPRAQRDIDTLAVVLPSVAQLIYKNAVKGDPPFKPQKGNYGHVSWFKGQGNPWIGGATGGGNSSGSNVTIHVTMPNPTLKADTYFETTMRGFETTHGLDRQKKEHGGTLWRLLGQSLEGDPLAEIPIPHDRDLNPREAGTFITAGAGGRDKVKLKDFKALADTVDKDRSRKTAVRERVRGPASLTIKVSPEERTKIGALRDSVESEDNSFDSKAAKPTAKLTITATADEVTVDGAAIRVRNIAKKADQLIAAAGIAQSVTKCANGLTQKAQVGHNAPVVPEDLNPRIQGSKTRTGIGTAMKNCFGVRGAEGRTPRAPTANDIASLILPNGNDALAGMTALWDTWTTNYRADWWDGPVDYAWHGDKLKLIVPVMKSPTDPRKTRKTKSTVTLVHTFSAIDI